MSKIIQGFPTPQKDQYKVYVLSVTFNHASYIEDCLNGAVMQQTTFPFVQHVIDDASNDGEQEVIKAWIENNCDLETAEYYDNDLCNITLAKAKNNTNYTIAAYFLKKNMYRKPEKVNLYIPWRAVIPYEAICEGDDYWIDPLKLQLQANYMTKHPECSLCVHNAFVYLWENKDSYIFNKNISRNRDLTEEEVISGWTAPTASMMYVIEKCHYPEELARIYSGDYSLMLILLNKGDIHFIDKVMSVYRKTLAGITNTTDLSFAYKEHLRLLESYDSYTKGKYSDIISKRIDFLKDLIIYIEIRQKHKYYKLLTILPFIINKLFKKQ